MNRTLKVSLFCAGIFACGAVAGGLAVLRFAPAPEAVQPEKRPEPPPEGFGPQVMRRLTAELGLTEAQRTEIDPLVKTAWEELRALRRESFAQSTRAMEAMDAAVAARLTPEQLVKFTELKEKERARMKKAWEDRQRRREEGGERRGGGDRPPEDAPPPPPAKES